MKQIFKLLLPVVVVTAMFYSCQKEDINPLKPAAGDYLLPLIETTDVHGHIVDASTDTVHYWLAYIADKVKDIRGHGGAYRKERLLLLDGGDLYQGTTIYQNGEWTSDWASRTLTVATTNYVATTDREDRETHLHNPLVGWCETSRLITNDLVDNENAIRVLKAEAEANNGLLSIDPRPHFIVYTE